jgi:lipopolysaccharide assembly outer membrane protein LptD (OstA)
MRLIVLVYFFILCLASPLAAQNRRSPKPDSLGVKKVLTQIDSLRLTRTKSDSLKADSLEAARSKKKNELKSIIKYTAKDSVIFEPSEKKMRMYGDGKVNYEEFKLTAPEISIDMAVSTLDAKSDTDSTGKPKNFPVFRDASGEYKSDKLTYNFQSKRGKISQGRTKIDNGFYTGDRIKRQPDDVLNIEDGYYTTCDLPHPHYYFFAKKMKIVPQDRIFAEPIVLYIEDVPVFWLPFAFFPNKTGRSSGIILPAVGSDSRGFVFEHMGYYLAESEYWDAQATVDLATRGSWKTDGLFRYSERYVLDGSLQGYYEKDLINSQGDPDFSRSESWNLHWTHQQTFTPTLRATADLNFASTNYLSNYSQNPNDRVVQQITSNATIYKDFEDVGRSSSLGYSRTQNLGVTSVAENYSANLTQQSLFPFKTKTSSPGALLSVISISGSTGLQVSHSATDTTVSWRYSSTTNTSLSASKTILGGTQTLSLTPSFSLQGPLSNANTFEADKRYGSNLSIPISYSQTLLKFLILSENFTFNKYWNDITVSKYYDTTLKQIQTVPTYGLESFNTYSLSTSLQTRAYGIWQPNTLGIIAFRHTFNPSISYTYTPDFSKANYGNYRTLNYTDSTGTAQQLKYSKFEGGIYQPPQGEQQSLGLSIANIFEAKVNTLDTTKALDDPKRNEKIIQLLTLNVSTAYNFAADSLRLANLAVSFANNSLGQLLQLSGSANFSFYGYDHTNGNTIRKFLIDDGGGLARLVNFSLTLGTTFSGERQNNPDRSKDTTLNRPQGSQQTQGVQAIDYTKTQLVGDQIDYDIPYTVSQNTSISIDKSNPLVAAVILASTTATVNFSLTPNWKIGTSGGYDYTNKKFIYPSINVSRDLHDWEMTFNWTPIGDYRSYRFEIHFKPAQLRDVKLQKNNSGEINNFP